MAKTLVIKGANFSANKVATVEFDRIHTTAFAIDDSSISLASIGATQQIEYTITPSNSEDPVEWSSSDESVCTVDSDGVVTAVGCGTATITGTSNGHSDTVSVTNEIVMTGFVRAPKTYVSSESASGHTSKGDTYIGISNSGYDSYMAMVAVDSTKTKLNAHLSYAHLNSETNKYYLPDSYNTGASKRLMDAIGYIVPIKLPANCSSIKLTALDAHYGAYVQFFKSETRVADTDAEQGYFSSYRAAGVTTSSYSFTYQQNTTVSVESGYDSIVVMWKADTANGATSFASLTEEQIAQFLLVCA